MASNTLEIHNITIIDGQKTPKYLGSILLQDDHILEIGPNVTPGSLIIDGTGLYASPGFIDVHTHVDFGFYQERYLIPLLTQGVTTTIAMNCGLGIFPCDAQIKRLYDQYANFMGILSMQEFDSPLKFLQWLDRIPKKINIGNLVPHGNLHVKVMGLQITEPTPPEWEKMELIFRECLDAGFFGLSLGLIYPPGAYLPKNSRILFEFGRICREYDSVLAAHIRDEMGGVMEASKELLEIGKETGCSIEYSHIKIASPLQKGRSTALLAMIDQYIAEGVNVHMDAYPYDIAGNMLATILFPPEFLMNITETELYSFLRTPEAVTKIYAFLGEKMLDMVNQMPTLVKKLVDLLPRKWIIDLVLNMMAKKMYFLSVLNEPALTGKTLYEAAQSRHLPIIHAAIDIIIRNRCQITTAPKVMDWRDINNFLLHPRCMIGSDLLILPDLKAHPRAYGSFTGFLKRYPQAQPNKMSWEEAIYKVSGLPASKFHVPHRGVLKAGNIADIVIFDPQQIGDTALIHDSERFSKGIHIVFVNGKKAYQNGSILPENYGCVILRDRTNHN